MNTRNTNPEDRNDELEQSTPSADATSEGTPTPNDTGEPTGTSEVIVSGIDESRTGVEGSGIDLESTEDEGDTSENNEEGADQEDSFGIQEVESGTLDSPGIEAGPLDDDVEENADRNANPEVSAPFRTRAWNQIQKLGIGSWTWTLKKLGIGKKPGIWGHPILDAEHQLEGGRLSYGRNIQQALENQQQERMVLQQNVQQSLANHSNEGNREDLQNSMADFYQFYKSVEAFTQCLAEFQGQGSSPERSMAESQVFAEFVAATTQVLRRYDDYYNPEVEPILDELGERAILHSRLHWIIKTLEKLKDRRFMYLPIKKSLAQKLGSAGINESQERFEEVAMLLQKAYKTKRRQETRLLPEKVRDGVNVVNQVKDRVWNQVFVARHAVLKTLMAGAVLYGAQLYMRSGDNGAENNTAVITYDAQHTDTINGKTVRLYVNQTLLNTIDAPEKEIYIEGKLDDGSIKKFSFDSSTIPEGYVEVFVPNEIANESKEITFRIEMWVGDNRTVELE